jgi:ribosomal 30S subunit maturation factor RimM
MKVGDLIKMKIHTREGYKLGLLVRIDTAGDKRVATVATRKGQEYWPLDSYYKIEVISERR